MLTVIETKRFAKDVTVVFTDDELAELISFLAVNPDAGDIIQGTGGFRKLRWYSGGKGKRGGARVIYLYWEDGYPLVLVRAYAKNVKNDLTSDEKRRLKEFAASFSFD